MVVLVVMEARLEGAARWLWEEDREEGLEDGRERKGGEEG